MNEIPCNQSMSRDTLGFTCGTYGFWAKINLSSEGLRPRGNMTYFRVSLLILERD